MHALYVTLGRNVGTEPMPLPTWEAFVASVREAIEAAIVTPAEGELVRTFNGSGQWGGVTEDSAILTVLVPDGESINVSQLEAQLETIRKWYWQDAIAVVLAASSLV